MDGVYAEWGRVLLPWLWPAIALAVASLTLGLILAAFVGRRRFARRNFAGIEEFGSYGEAVGHRLVEALAGLLASVLLAVGLLAFALALGGFIFGPYSRLSVPANGVGQRAPTSTPTGAGLPQASVNVEQAKKALKHTAPSVYKTLTDPSHPKTAVRGSQVTYEWNYLDKRNPATVQVRRVQITLNADGEIAEGSIP
jgi:hypothetical protein